MHFACDVVLMFRLVMFVLFPVQCNIADAYELMKERMKVFGSSFLLLLKIVVSLPLSTCVLRLPETLAKPY